MKRTALALAAMFTLVLSGCGSAAASTADNRTATGADAEYVAELIDSMPVFDEVPDTEILKLADDFCYILKGTTTPSKAMGILYDSMSTSQAESFAIMTVSAKCSNELFSLTRYLGYK